MKKLILSISLIITSVFFTVASVPLTESANSAAARQWADSVMNQLSAAERVAQLFVPMINPQGGASSEAIVKSIIGKHHMGGLLFSKGTLDEYASLITIARKSAEVPPLITFDGEWGLSMRIASTPRFPQNMGLGAIRDTKLLYDYGLEVGREMKQLGISVNFAPVLDVNTNPANPVIGYRSFGESPLRVANCGAAYAAGLEAAGVMAVAKHFPGHGDTSVDSHKALPTVNHSEDEIRATDLVPFEKFIADGGSGVMTGHLSVPSLDPSLAPASLSKKITTGLLREQMKFNGLIFTDALAMKGAHTNDNNNCVSALIAGADIVLASSAPASDLNAVLAAVKSGKIKQSAIDEKCRRVLCYKYALGLNRQKPINRLTLDKEINSPKAEAINQKLANASITLLRDKSSIIPVGNLADNSIAVVCIGGAGHEFTNLCRKYGNVTVYQSAARVERIKKHTTVIAAVFSDTQSSRAHLSQLNAAVKNLVEVFFINPYKMAKFSTSLTETGAVMLAYDNTKATERAAAQAVFGGIGIDGQLPVSLKGIAGAGEGLIREKSRLGYSSPAAEKMSMTLPSTIDSIVDEAIRLKAFPGCQILVAKNGNVVIDKSYGKQSMTGHLNVEDNTVFDLASVSKATGTLPGIMKAYDLGLFKLGDKASDHIPGLRPTDKADITVKELLYHESGIRPSLNIYEVMIDSDSYTGKLISPRWSKSNSIKIGRRAFGNNRAKIRTDITSPVKNEKFPFLAGHNLYVGKETYDTLMNRIYTSPLRKDKSYAYSCLNFCLLMDMEQRLTGISHDRWVADSIFKPLGCTLAGYRPLERMSLNQIASTEHDPFLRKQTICGYVHDELADMSGGVQGNAGLFANAGDLAKLCQMWLNKGTYGDARILSSETVDLFTKSKSKTCRRGLGFDKPDKENPDNSPTCDEASAATYGHLGFTGTVFWVDPDEQLIFIFLCNRVNPTRDNDAFSRLNVRPKLFSEVYRSLEK